MKSRSLFFLFFKYNIFNNNDYRLADIANEFNMNISYSNISITTIHCYVYRGLGSILIIASLINIYECLRYFTGKFFDKRQRLTIHRMSPIMISMLLSSIVVIFISTPFIVIQCFTCQAYFSYDAVCQIHGFICFAVGLFQMYIVALLSFSRYVSVLHKPSKLNRLMEQHVVLHVICCALLAVIWSVLPAVGLVTRFIREGVGFYCSLDWKDPSINARIFLICAIIFNYCIPLIILIYSNLQICLTLHRLLNSRDGSRYIPLSRTSCPSKGSDAIDPMSLETDLHRSLPNTRVEETENRLQRLKFDRRYALIAAMIAAQYLIAWTPYTFVELLNIGSHSTIIQRYPFIPTHCALLAKLSLIINPLILMYSNKMTEG